MTKKVISLMKEVETSTNFFPIVETRGENEIAPEIDPAMFEVDEPESLEVLQTSVEPIETLYINPLSNDFPYVLYQGEDEMSLNIENAMFGEDEPLLMEICQIPAENVEKMTKITLRNSFPYVLYQGKNEIAPDIDPVEFEADEPELIEILQNSKNIYLFNNPCLQDLENNAFFESSQLEAKNTNLFYESLDKNSNPFHCASEEPINCATKLCVPQMKHGFSPEDSSSQHIVKHLPTNRSPQDFELENINSFKGSMDASTHVSQKKDEFSPKVSRPQHILKRKVNSFISWIKAKCTFPNPRRYEMLN